MDNRPTLTLEEATEWRAPIWAPAVDRVLKEGQKYLPPGSKILELGFNSGSMSCYMHLKYDWDIEGVDLFPEQAERARRLSEAYQIPPERMHFHALSVDEIRKFQGTYDGIFIKSVLYHMQDFPRYQEFLQQLHSLLRPGGVLMAVENGQGHTLDRIYRKRLNWGKNLLFNAQTEKAFRERFPNFDACYFGGLSQYLTWCPPLCRLAQLGEKKLGNLGPENCFIASIVALKS